MPCAAGGRSTLPWAFGIGAPRWELQKRESAGKLWQKALRAFRLSPRELGWIEGKNILIEDRWAEGNYARIPELAADLIRLRVDLIVTRGST